MKWVLVLIYVGGMGTPVTRHIAAFTYEKDCRGAATDFVKKNPTITATCDYSDPDKEKDK